MAFWVDRGLGILPPGPGTTRTGEAGDPGTTSRFHGMWAVVPLTP